MAAKKDKPRPLTMPDREDIVDEIGAEPADPEEPNGVMVADIEKIRQAGAMDPESIQSNRRNEDVVNRKKGNEKGISFDDPNIVLKYEDTIKIWPVNTLSIYVNRLTGTQVQHQILSQPRNGPELYNEIKLFHGRREESLYEVIFRDSVHGEYRGKGRITMASTLNEPALPMQGMQGQIMQQPPPYSPGYAPHQVAPQQPPVVQVMAPPVPQQQPGTDLAALMKQMLEMYRLMQPQQQQAFQLPPPAPAAPPAPAPSQDPNVVAMTQMMEMMRTMIPQQPAQSPPVVFAAAPAPSAPPPADNPMMTTMAMMREMFAMMREMQPPPPPPPPPPPAEPQYRGPRPYAGPAYGPRSPDYAPQAYGPPQGMQRQRTAEEVFNDASSVIQSAIAVADRFRPPVPQQQQPQYASEEREEEDRPLMRVVDAGPAKLVVNTTDGSTRGWDTAVMNAPGVFKWLGEQVDRIHKNAQQQQQQQAQQQLQRQQLPPGYVEMTPGYQPPPGFVAIPIDQIPQQQFVQQPPQVPVQQYHQQPQQQFPSPPVNLPPTIDEPLPPQQQSAWGMPEFPPNGEEP